MLNDATNVNITSWAFNRPNYGQCATRAFYYWFTYIFLLCRLELSKLMSYNLWIPHRCPEFGWSDLLSDVRDSLLDPAQPEQRPDQPEYQKKTPPAWARRASKGGSSSEQQLSENQVCKKQIWSKIIKFILTPAELQWRNVIFTC